MMITFDTTPTKLEAPGKISASTLTAPKRAQATAPNDAAKGGKGGEGGAPPLPPSNAEFLAAVVREVTAGAAPAVCSKPGDPTEGGWHAHTAIDIDSQCPPEHNNYFNCSTFELADDGEVRARKENFSGFHVLMLDDVGTKVARARLGDAVPTYEIETSPGNSQIGFRLREPLRAAEAVKQLQDAVIAAGLCDPGANGAARWARLPYAVNGKQKYRDTDGSPFRARLVQWNPETAYSVEDLTTLLGLELREQPIRVRSMPGAVTRSVAAPWMIASDVWSPPPHENPVIAALKAQGLHKRETSPGVHDITCPWLREHTDSIDTGTAYFEPDEHRAVGGFKCQHSHGDKYHVGELLKFLDVDGDAARGKATIRLVPGELNRIGRAAEMALVLHGNYYQSGGAIVSIRVNPVTHDVYAETLSDPALATALGDAADWMRRDKTAWIRTDPPQRNVTALLKAQTFHVLPPLSGLSRQPFFRDAGGALVVTPGYDAESGRYAAFDPAEFAMPEPTEEAARAALATLRELVGEFKFANESDEAAAICAMLTGAVRPALEVAPAFNITASSPGSGKSYLAATITPFAGPGTPLRMSYPADGNEATKAMLAALLPGPAAILFDDMQTQWVPHSTMNRMLTSDTITDRLLGTNLTRTVGTRTLVLGTGNNIGPVRDMNRRVVTIRLYHRAATPALVKYQDRPVERLTAQRGRYVAAALTIIQAWREAGSPRADVPSIASYEDWSDLCRQPLIWLGLTDPAASIIEQLTEDPETDLLGALLRAWNAAVGDRPITLRDLLEHASDHAELMEAIEDLPVTSGGAINRDKLGWYFRKHVDRPVSGLELRHAVLKERKGWRVVPVAPD